MANVAWSVFFPDLLVEVPYVSHPIVERALREAAIEFCRRSNAWVHVMDPIPLAAGQAVYDWDIPADSLVQRPLEVWAGGDKLDPISSAELSAIYGGEWQDETSTPLYYLSEEVDGGSRQVTLAPTPNAAILPGMTARLVLKPTRTATGIAEVVYEDYGRQIATGALARLLHMSGVQWANPKLGAKHEQDFDLAVARASIRAAKGHVGAPLRARTQHGVV